MPERAFSEMGDAMTRALVGGDFGLYRKVMRLPLTIAPEGGTAYLLSDEAALREDFDLYHAILKVHGVTDIFRDVLDVLPEGDGHRVICNVHILVRAYRIVEPFRSEMLIHPAPEGWVISEIRSTAGHIDWTLGRARIGPGRDFLQR